MNMDSYFSLLPREINSSIFSYLSLNVLLSLVRSSKIVADLVQAVLSDEQAAPNALNILVTGLPSAGSTTLYSRLKAELDVKLHIKNLSLANEAPKTSVKLVNDNAYQIEGIQLQNVRANIWHGSTRKNQAKMMYGNCGACQTIIYVVFCEDMEPFKAKLRQDLVTYHAVTSDVEWIFVINKMDIVQYNEQEYNKCVESLKKVAVKVIGAHRLDQMHFIPMSAQDTSTRLTSDYKTNMPWHNNDKSLRSILNHVASNRPSLSVLKLVKKFNASVVKYFPNLSTDNTRVVGVYMIVGDGIQIFSTGVNKREGYKSLFASPGFYYDARRVVPAKVIEIQSNHSARKIALPNSYVTLKLNVGAPPRRKYHFVRFPEIPLVPKESYYPKPIYRQFHAVLLHVGDVVPEYKWNGLINQGYNGSIHSLGIRSGVVITTILTVWDKNGNKLDLKQLTDERKQIGIKKGEKAEVLLQPDAAVSVLNLTIRSPSNDACGRFVLMNQKSHVVAVGCIDQLVQHATIKN